MLPRAVVPELQPPPRGWLIHFPDCQRHRLRSLPRHAAAEIRRVLALHRGCAHQFRLMGASHTPQPGVRAAGQLTSSVPE